MNYLFNKGRKISTRLHYIYKMSLLFSNNLYVRLIRVPRRLRIRFGRPHQTREVPSFITGSHLKYSLADQGIFDFKLLSRAVFFVQEFVNNDLKRIENDLKFNFDFCMTSLGIKPLHYWPKREILNGNIYQKTLLEEFEEFLQINCPEIIFIDANFRAHQKTFSSQSFSKLKEKYGFKIALVVPDFKPKNIEYWSDISDVIVMTLPLNVPQISNVQVNKIVCIPFLPINLDLTPSSWESRHLDFFFSGTRNKERDLFVNRIRRLPITANINFHNRSANLATSYGDYIKELGNSKSTFSNGFISSKLNFISARFCEAILTGTFCFYEYCPNLELFFLPNVHFKPVKTAADLYFGILDLKKNERAYESLARDAFDFANFHYNYRAMYSRIFEVAFRP